MAMNSCSRSEVLPEAAAAGAGVGAGVGVWVGQGVGVTGARVGRARAADRPAIIDPIPRPAPQANIAASIRPISQKKVFRVIKLYWQ
jgi:hypothetical protein